MSYLLDNGRRVMRGPVGGAYYDGMPGGDMFDDAEVLSPEQHRPPHEI